jgi:O-Antigen ligase
VSVERKAPWLKYVRPVVDDLLVSRSTAILERESMADVLPVSATSRDSTANNALLGRLAAASVVCTPFWLPIVNDWHSWSTGLVVTLGEVPLIGFTLLAAPKTLQSIRSSPFRSEHQRVLPANQQPPETGKPAGLDRYVLGLLVLLIALTISAVAHPHVRGLQMLWRILAMICLGEHVISRRIRATTIVHALIGITTFEAVLAIWQRITHKPMGLGILGESPVPFYDFGRNGFAVNGTLPHPYPLAALALVGGSAAIVFGSRRLISSRVAALGAAASAIIIGLTISRAGLLSAAGIVMGTLVSALTAWWHSRTGLVNVGFDNARAASLGVAKTRAAKVKLDNVEEVDQCSAAADSVGAATGIAGVTDINGAVVRARVADEQNHTPQVRLRLTLLGVFVVGLASSMGASKAVWSGRAAIQRQGQSVNEMSSARGDRLQEGLGVYKLNPILGVGPGRYVIALAQHPELLHSSPEDALPAHNAALTFLAEGGIPTALALLAVALVLGRRLLSLGADGLIMISAVFPFLMLDIVFVSLPSGLFLVGVWAALVSSLRDKTVAR